MKKALTIILCLALLCSVLPMVTVLAEETAPALAVEWTLANGNGYTITKGGPFSALKWAEDETVKPVTLLVYNKSCGALRDFQVCDGWGSSFYGEIAGFADAKEFMEAYNPDQYNRAWNKLFPDDQKAVAEQPIEKPAATSGTSATLSLAADTFKEFTVNVPKNSYAMNYQTRYLIKDNTQPEGVLDTDSNAATAGKTVDVDYAVYYCITSAEAKDYTQWGIRVNGSNLAADETFVVAFKNDPASNAALAATENFNGVKSLTAITDGETLAKAASEDFADILLPSESETSLADGKAFIDMEGPTDASLFKTFGAAKAVRSKEQAYNGKASLKVTTGTAGYESVALAKAVLEAVIDEPGTYKVSGYVYVDKFADDKTAIGGGMNNRPKNNSQYGTTGSYKWTKQGEWEFFTTNVSLPCGSNVADSESPDYWLNNLDSLAWDGAGAAGTAVFYLDDISFEKLPPMVGRRIEVTNAFTSTNYYSRIGSMASYLPDDGDFNLTYTIYNDGDNDAAIKLYFQDGWSSANMPNVGAVTIPSHSKKKISSPTLKMVGGKYAGTNGEGAIEKSAISLRFDFDQACATPLDIIIEYNDQNDPIKVLAGGGWTYSEVDTLPTFPPKALVNGDAESGKVGWGRFSAVSGGSVSQVTPGANGTEHAILFTPGSDDDAKSYESVAFDLGPAIAVYDDTENTGVKYEGGGAGMYKITFWAKAADTVKGEGKFTMWLNSQAHGSKDSKFGEYVSTMNTYTGGTVITMTDEWTPYEILVNVSQDFLDNIYGIAPYSANALQLVLRFDGFGNGAYPYLVDEVTIDKLNVNEGSTIKFVNYKGEEDFSMLAADVASTGEYASYSTYIFNEVSYTSKTELRNALIAALFEADGELIELVVTQAEPSVTLGDVNGDGEVNSDDLTKMARFVAKIITTFEEN